jgi:hypothetical protein
MLVRKFGFVSREMSRDIIEEFGRYDLPERAVQLIENWMTNRVSLTRESRTIGTGRGFQPQFAGKSNDPL